MNKKFILRKNEEIQKIVKSNNKIVNKYFVIYYDKNNLGFNRYCVSVSKKLGSAVNRNLYKRRIKDILMKNYINNSNDYVIILRNSILGIDYKIIECELVKLVKGEI
jgi:ribonuclease P protein component